MIYDFMAFDFETARNGYGYACSIGIAAVKGMELVAREHHLIKPPTKDFDYPYHIAKHGIRYDDVKNEKTFGELWPEISHYWGESAFILAHSASFDVGELRACLNNCSASCCDFLYINSMDIADFFSPGLASNGLEAVCEYYDVDLLNHHNALCDAEAICNFIFAILRRDGMNSFFQMVPSNFAKPVIGASVQKAKTSGSKKKSSAKKKIKDFTPSSPVTDTTHPFYGKTFCITGKFPVHSKNEISQMIVDKGGILMSSVSRNTNYLVAGTQISANIGSDGLSDKERNARDYNSKGANITILTAKEFFSML